MSPFKPTQFKGLHKFAQLAIPYRGNDDNPLSPFNSQGAEKFACIFVVFPI